jgi:hypothetical protein
MSIHKIADISFSALAQEKYDVGVFASGYEARCTFVPKKCSFANMRNSLVIGFKDLADTEPRKAHDEYFRSDWKVEPVIASSGNDFVVQVLLNDIVSKGARVRRMLVDCSSMSRLWYSGILNWARFGNSADETVIDFVYALGRYEENNLPMVIEDMVTIPGCEGGALQSQQSLAIFGLGFNGWASLCILERLEADDVFAFIASPGASPDYPGRVRELNKDFLEEPRVKQHVFELPLRSVETTYRYLSELVTPHRFKDSVTLVPMGPKPHVLASMLVSMRFPEVSCMRVSAKRARPEKVEPTGEIVAVRVVIRKTTVKAAKLINDSKTPRT